MSIKNVPIIDGLELREAVGIDCLSDECYFVGDEPNPDSAVWLYCSAEWIKDTEEEIANYRQIRTSDDIWNEDIEWEARRMENDLKCMKYVHDILGLDKILVQL